MLEVLTIKRDDFAVSAHCEGRVITASLRGNADHAAVELVEVLLDRILPMPACSTSSAR